MPRMGVLSIYKPLSDNRAVPFCKCRQRQSVGNTPYGGDMSSGGDKLTCTCKCGESDCKRMNWSWDASIAHPETQISDHTVLFHPVYSQGTSIVRGEIPLASQHIHYWEIKIITCMSGTDMVSKENFVY